MKKDLAQFLHFPKGNGSYTVAENISKSIGYDCPLFALGERSLGIYTDSDVPVIHSHPYSNGKPFSEMSPTDYIRHRERVASALGRVDPPCISIVHHGLTMSNLLSDQSDVITYLHGTEMLGYHRFPDELKNDFCSGLEKSYHILTMSSKQKELAKSLFGDIITCKLTVQEGGINDEIFRPTDQDIRPQYGLSEDKNLILYAGRLSVEKNIDILIQAMDPKLNDSSQLVIVGNGNSQGNLEELAQDRDVVFTGAVSQTELAKLMSTADVFVLPSMYESFGLVAIEALASGTPVVSSDVGVLSDLVNEPHGGYIVPLTSSRTDDANRFSEAIKDALTMDKEKFQSYHRTIVNRYAWSNVLSDLRNIIKERLDLSSDDN